LQETLYLITLKTIKHMKFSTKAATFLSSIKTQTYDKNGALKALLEFFICQQVIIFG